MSLSDEDELKPGHLMMKMEPSQNTDLPRCRTADSDRSGFYSCRFVLDGSGGGDDPPLMSPLFLNQWRLFHMTASPRFGPTRQKTRRFLVDAAVWMFQADRGATGAAGSFFLTGGRMEGEAVRARVASRTRQRGNVDRIQRSTTHERMSHSAALTSPVCTSRLYLFLIII